MRIFIVEDEMINALSLKKELVREGYQVCGMAAHSAAAMARVRETRPDLLIMDINLGTGPNGIETARLIREELPLPIIFMTGYGDWIIRQRAEPLAPLACLDKPLDVPLLLELLEEFADAHGAPGRGGEVAQ